LSLDSTKEEKNKSREVYISTSTVITFFDHFIEDEEYNGKPDIVDNLRDLWKQILDFQNKITDFYSTG
jgi:hypothetical protein